MDLSLPDVPLPGAVKGILDTSPVDGAGRAVTLIDTNGTRVSVTTGADGVFQFPEVNPGLYALDVRVEGFAPLVVPNIRVKAGQTVDLGILQLIFLQSDGHANGLIRGKVVSELGPAIQGATVDFFLASSADPLTSAVSDADGVFSAQVAPGTWRLLAHHPWYEQQELLDQAVADGATLDLRMTPLQLKIVPATITGTVLLERDGADPVPAEGANVDLEGGLAHAVVDAQGHFTMIKVVAGSHQLTVSGIADYADPQPGRTVTIGPNTTTDIGTITLALERATVRGTVETADQAPADGINVTLEPLGYGTTAAAGQVNYLAGYRIAQVPYGDYTLTVSKQGYFRVTRAVTVDKASIEPCPTTPPVPNDCVPHVQLAPQSGDFVLDDLDDTNRPGYTKSTDVVVVFTSAVNAVEMRASEDSTFSGVSFVPYANNAHFALTTTEGVKTVYVQLKDNTGLVGATLRASITLDSTPPAAPAVSFAYTGLGAGGIKFTSATSTLPLTVVSTDSQSGIYYMRITDDPTLDGNGLLTVANLQYQSNTSYSRNTTADGVQHVYAQVIDYAGNASSLGEDVITVDDTDPQGTSLSAVRGPAATEDGYTNQPLVVLNLTADPEPDGGKVEVRLSNVEAVLSQTTYQSLLPSISWLLDTGSDGPKTVFAQFRDTALNENRFAQTTLIYDSTPPSPVSASINLGATGDAGVIVHVATSATDLSVTEGITVSESPGFTDANTVGPMPMPAGGDVNFTLQRTDGVHTVYARFKDKAGNTSVVTTQVTFDGAPPSPPVFSLTATGMNGTTKFTRFNSGLTLPFTISGIDALSGVAQMRLSTSSAVDASGRLTSGTNFTYSTSGSFTWTGAQGPVTVYAQLIDAAGNVSGLASDTIVVDTVAPSGGISIAPGAQASAGFTNSGTVSVSLTSPTEPNGGAVSFKMANDNGTGLTQAGFQDFTPTVTWFLDTSSEGAKTVYAVFRDSAGNTSSTTSANITYDVTAPGGTISTVASTRTRPVSVTVSSSATDLATLPLTLSESSNFAGATPQALSTPVTFTLANTGDGPRTIYARFRDKAGNDTIATAPVTLDASPPAAPAFSLTATGTNGTTRFTRFGTALAFTISGVDTGSGVTQMRLSTSSTVDANGLLTSGTTSAYATSGSFTYAGTQGAVTLYAQLLDAAGNASALTSDAIVVDSVAPTGTVTIAKGAQASVAGFTNNGTVNVTLAATAEPAGGALQFKIANDNGAGLSSAGYQDLTGSLAWFIDTSSEGVKTVYVMFKDSAGNETASPVSGSITYDVTPPNGTLSAPSSTRTRPVSLTVSSSATDLSATPLTLSEISTFAGATAQALSSPVTFTLANTGDGPRTVYARFRDKAGNDTVVSAAVTLDSTPPPAPVFALTATGTNNGVKFTRGNSGLSLPFTISGSDSETSVAQMRLSTSSTVDANGLLTSGTTSAYATAGNYTWNNTQGAVTIYAQLIDAAGNASALASDTVVVDTVVPTGTVTIAKGTLATSAGFTNSATVSVSLSAANEPAGGALQFKIANDNGAGLTGAGYQDLTTSLSWLLDSSSDGLKTVYVMLRDSAGNETASPVSASITYDSTAPTPASASITPSTTRTTAITVTVSSSAGDLSTTEALTLSESSSFSGAGTVGPMAMPGGGTQAFTLSSGGDGLRTVYARFKDKAGNTTVVPATVTVDTAPPTGSISMAGTLGDGVTQSSVATSTTSVRVTFNITGAVDYLLGDASLSTCPASGYTAVPAAGYVDTTLAAGADGVRQVRACFRDAAGNVFGGLNSGLWVPSASITYDTTAPSGCTLTLAGKARNGAASPVAGKTALTNIGVTANACTGVPTQMAIVSGSVACASTPSLPWQGYTSGPVAFTIPNQEGSQQVTVCLRDAALVVGNATVSAGNITLDTSPPTAPVVSITSPASNGYTNAQSVTVTGSADDAQRWAVAAASTGPFTFITYTGTPSVTNYNFGADGAFTAYAVFVDDVGNQTSPVSASTIIDTAAPAAPRFYSVDMSNRAAHLFWDTVTDPSGILKYELWCGTSSPTTKCGEVDGTKSDGWVLNLNNRRDQVFAVKAVDRATNASAFSQTLTGAVGFKRLAVPINSSYSVAPLDVATEGDNIYVTFSERDANWTLHSGNLKIAVSNDRGVSWRISTLDSAFGIDRSTGHIGFTDSATVVATVGSASPDYSDQGQVRVYSTIDDGFSWQELTNSTLATSTHFASPSGIGLVTSGQRVATVFRQFDDAGVTLAYNPYGGDTSVSTSMFLSGALYLPSSSVSGIKSCSGNYSASHAWRRGTSLDVLTQYFINLNTADTTTGTAVLNSGVLTDFSDYDVSCVSLPEATKTHVVGITNSFSSGTLHSLYFRKKTSASAAFGTTLAIASDADSLVSPKIWAGGRNVFVLYRNAAGQLTMLESADEGGSWITQNRSHLENNPDNGYAAVMSGENSQDVSVAYTDSTGSTLTVLVPGVPAVRSQLAAGVGLEKLSWSPVSGISRYQVASGPGSTFTDFNYSSLVSYDVLPSSPTALTSYSVRAVDENNMPGNDGYTWQAEPAISTVIFTDAGFSGAQSATGGIVAYNTNAMILPPQGIRSATGYDLTVYRTTNSGQSWTAYTPFTLTTTGARAIAGFGDHATVFYRRTGLNGVSALNYGTLGPTGVPTTFTVDGSGTVYEGEYIAAQADPANQRVLVAYTDVDSGYIRTALGVGETDGGITYTAGTAFQIPGAGSGYEIKALDVAKLDGSRAVLTWREENTSLSYEAVYMADNINITNPASTWNTPGLVRGGYYTLNTGTDAVSTTTRVAGTGNSSYTTVAYASNDNPFNRHSENLYLGVTGTDVNTSGFTVLALDHDQVDGANISTFSNGDGQYVSYLGTDVTSGANRLKLAYCPFDCHLLASWRRSFLYGTGSYYAPLMTVAQTTTNNTPVYYLSYVNYNPGIGYELRILRGGVHRLSR